MAQRRWTGLDATCQRYRRLTNDEETALVEKARAGCFRSRDFLIENNLSFIISELVKKYPQMDYSELLGSAAMGMDEAIKRFDPDSGYRFISYAVWWIKSHVQQQIAEDRLIKEPGDYYYKRWQLLNRMKKYNETAEEAGDVLGISEQVRRQMKKSFIALDSAVSDDSETTFAEVITDPEAMTVDAVFIADDMREDIWRCLKKLKGQDYEVIMKRFGFDGGTPMQLQQIGKEWGVTRERIRQIELKAKKKLMRYFKRAGIDADAINAFIS